MAVSKDGDVGRVMAALGSSPMAYRSFAAPPSGPVDPERAANCAAAFPLLAAALPEMTQIGSLPVPPAPPQPTLAPPVTAATAIAMEPPFVDRSHAQWDYNQRQHPQQRPAAASWQGSVRQPAPRVPAHRAAPAQPFPPRPTAAPAWYPTPAPPPTAEDAAATSLAGVFLKLRGSSTSHAPQRREARSELEDMFGSL
jgi:hypothetical protein